MRFYLPDWDDNVDAEYDFIHDENSRLRKSERPLNYIWDFYGRKETPIDGVLISREQVEDTTTKRDRLRKHGVYDNPEQAGGIADWLPVISDCGAFGYRRLPSPPYENEEMLTFYQDLQVSVGVTIDHLILDNTPTSRLYLDKRALPTHFRENDLPGAFGRSSAGPDVMVADWRTESKPGRFDPTKFNDTSALLDAVETDPHAVYVEDDRQYRYDLTLQNAKEMREAYDKLDDPSFRLMAAIQGWSPQTYADAAERVLEMGYDYIGIGGLAMAGAETVERVVEAVGEVVAQHQERYDTRVDTHIFGFAKQGVFDTIANSNVSSFDSASMLRASWTGGDNYHLSDGRKYYGIRVHPSTPQRDLRESIALELRGQEVLHALRAYANHEPIDDAIEQWQVRTQTALKAIREYLRKNRHNPRFDRHRLTDVRQELSDGFEYDLALKAGFGNLRREIARLLREDSSADPLPFHEYEKLIKVAREEAEEWYPGYLPLLEQATDQFDKWQGSMLSGDPDENRRLEQVVHILRDYTSWYDNKYDDDESDYLPEYRRTLEDRPWEECECTICESMGIDVVFFRRNNRNRRRGFHNIYQFYQEFKHEIPKTLVVATSDDDIELYDRVEDYLTTERSEFWSALHDLPVCEVGALTDSGVHEWWSDSPGSDSVPDSEMADALADQTARYQHLLVYGELPQEVKVQVEENDCKVYESSNPEQLRATVIDVTNIDADSDRTIQTTTDSGG